MKDYQLTIQEESNFCLCSALQAIFRKRDIFISQRKIANNLTFSKKGFLANDFEIKKFLNQNGFEYSFYWYNETPFNEPDELLKEMDQQDGIIGVKNHIYLLNNFKDPTLFLINPENACILKKGIYPLLNEMCEEDGFFGLLKYIF